MDLTAHSIEANHLYREQITVVLKQNPVVHQILYPLPEIRNCLVHSVCQIRFELNRSNATPHIPYSESF